MLPSLVVPRGRTSRRAGSEKEDHNDGKSTYLFELVECLIEDEG